jgi:hypothetical protein
VESILSLHGATVESILSLHSATVEYTVLHGARVEYILCYTVLQSNHMMIQSNHMMLYVDTMEYRNESQNKEMSDQLIIRGNQK